MKDKINIAKLLKDCPSGMELDCTMFENVFFDCVTDNPIYPIRLYVQSEKDSITLTSFGCTTPSPYAKCVIFPKGKTTWEGFQRPFKDGDVICLKFDDYNIIAIFKQTHKEFCYYYVGVKNGSKLQIPDLNAKTGIFCTSYAKEITFATEEEKQKLFQVIKDNGYKWNAETKTLSKLVQHNFEVGNKIEKCGYRFTIAEVKDDYYLTKCGNKIPIDNQDDFSLVPNKFDVTTLKPFDSKVLVRDKNTEEWRGHFFSHYDSNSDKPYVCIGVEGLNEYKQCIPYEGNEHLFGTTNDCDEFYKTW